MSIEEGKIIEKSVDKYIEQVVTKMEKKRSIPKPENIQKKMQYRQLLELLKRGRYVSSRITAKALGVDWKTICGWMKTDEVHKIASQTIDRYTKGMEEAGKKDWRAYDRLLGYAVNGINKDDGSNGGNIINVYNQEGKVAIVI